MNFRLGAGTRSCRIAFKPKLGIALLGMVLVMQARAAAQPVERPSYGFQAHSAKARSAENVDPLAANPASFEAASTALALGYKAAQLPAAPLSSAAFGVFECAKTAPPAGSDSVLTDAPLPAVASATPSTVAEESAEDSKNRPLNATWRRSELPDFNRRIYYKNKLEFSWENGWLPNNIPFVFALFIGHQDKLSGLNYTMVPFIASVRWHMTNIGGPWIFRGNWDFTFSGAYTFIPRGPETRYWAYISGFRRNFVQRNWKVVPYLEGRAGLGDINAKGPYASKTLKEENRGQGQDFTFTVLLGGGARYNLNPRYSISAGVAYMHVSNLYLSEPAVLDEGINVYGPIFGINIRLGKPKQ